MPDIRVTNLRPQSGSFDELEENLAAAAADDPTLGLMPSNFKVHFVHTQCTRKAGEVVMIEVVGLFDVSSKGTERTQGMRQALTERLAAVMQTFVTEHAPSTKQIHSFCPQFVTTADGFHLINLTSTA